MTGHELNEDVREEREIADIHTNIKENFLKKWLGTFVTNSCDQNPGAALCQCNQKGRRRQRRTHSKVQTFLTPVTGKRQELDP
jgi:hypothetical protein